MYQNGAQPPWKSRSSQHTHQAIWYYLVGKSKTGKTILIGPEPSSKVANEKGFQAFDGVFEVFELPTKDRAKATQQLKAKLLDSTGDLSEALKPVSHTVEIK